MWFWRDVVDDIPLKPENFRILHPEVIHKTEQALQKYILKQKNVSTCIINVTFYVIYILRQYCI